MKQEAAEFEEDTRRRRLVWRLMVKVSVWLTFGVYLAVVPFPVAKIIHRKKGEVAGWADIIHPLDLLLISIALAGGAAGEMWRRKMLNPLRKMGVFSWCIFTALMVIVVGGMCLYAYNAAPGAEESKTITYWS